MRNQPGRSGALIRRERGFSFSFTTLNILHFAIRNHVNTHTHKHPLLFTCYTAKEELLGQILCQLLSAFLKLTNFLSPFPFVKTFLDNHRIY